MSEHPSEEESLEDQVPTAAVSLPGSSPGPSPLEAGSLSLEALAERIDARPGEVYAILCAADEPRVWDKVDELGYERALSLFNGYAAEKHRHIAPYLVVLDRPLLEWIREHLFGASWGIFVSSTAGFLRLRRKLHSMLMAKDPEGKALYFRYYDGPVLEAYLGACTEEEVRAFFGEQIEECAFTSDGGLRTLAPKKT